jgi:flagellar hook-length control protein FliK
MTDTTMVQTMQAPANAVAMGTTRQQAYANAAKGMNDPFGAIIAQMLSQAQQGTSLFGSAEQAGQSDKEKLEQMLAQGVSGILQMPQVQSSDLLQMLQSGTASADALQAVGTAGGDVSQELLQLAAMMNQNSLSGMQNMNAVSQDVLEALLQRSAGTAQPEEAAQAGAVPVEITVQQTMPEAASESKADTAFSQLMQGEAAAEPEKAEDVQNGKNKASEAFSQALAADAAKEAPQLTSLSETQMAKAESMAREPELLQQLEKTINESLSTGRQELTMKLKPESLGEITVRLVEREGKMTLDITAANAQTAKLINSDLTALREAVRPMNVEVHEAVQQSTTTSQGTTEYNLFGQQFSGQQQFANQQAWHQAAARTAHRTESFDDTVQQVAAESEPASAASLSALDTYV